MPLVCLGAAWSGSSVVARLLWRSKSSSVTYGDSLPGALGREPNQLRWSSSSYRARAYSRHQFSCPGRHPRASMHASKIRLASL